MTTPKKPANPRALAMYRKEIEAAHEALNLADMPERSGVMLTERCASVVHELNRSRAHLQALALKVAEFVGEIVTIFGVSPPDGDAVRNSDLLLAELRKVRELHDAIAKQNDKLDSRSTRIRVAIDAAGVAGVEPYPDEPVDERERSLRTGGRCVPDDERVRRLANQRDQARAEGVTLVEENLRLRAELDAAVEAMGKPDACRPAHVDSRAVIAALGGMCCALAGGNDANPETWIERATDAAKAARGLS